MRIFLLILSIIWISLCYCLEEPLKILGNYADDAIDSICEQIDSTHTNMKTIILPFRGYSDYSVEEFLDYKASFNYDERYFEDLIYEKLILLKKFKVFTRSKLEHALEELNLQHSDLFDLEKANEVGKFVGAEVIFIIEGYIGAQGYNRYKDFGAKYYDSWFIAKILVIEIETGEAIAYWHERKKYK